MHTSRGFPFVHLVALVGFAALAGVALGQVPGPATAPAAATGAPATQPVIGERALHKAVAEAQWFLGDIRSSNEVKVAACELLRRLGPGAREAAPALAAALRDEPPVRPAAVEALRAIGPDAIPALLEACDRRNRDAARLAATALLRSMPQSKDAVQGLTDQVRDAPDSSRRELAIDGLAALGPLGGRESVVALVEALGDPVPWVAAAAVRALSEVDPGLDPAVLKQCTALFSGDWQKQVNAAGWLGASNPQNPAVRGIAGTCLAAAMKDRELMVRQAASAALARLRPPPDSVIPVILGILRHPPQPDGSRVDNRAVADALGVLRSLGPQAAGAAPDVVMLLDRDDQQVVERATAALLAIGPGAAPALIATVGRRDADDRTRCRAAAALSDVYPCDEASIGALTKALRDPNESVRLAAATALGTCAPAPTSARPALAAALRDASPDVRRAALHAWTILDPTGQAGQAPDVPVLVGVLKGDDNPARADAASVLGAIGPWAAGQALPPLTRMVDNREPYLRRAAALALAKLHPDGRGLTPALIAAVRHADADARSVLAAAVRRSPERAEAARRLRAMSKDESDGAVRAEADRAAKDLE